MRLKKSASHKCLRRNGKPTLVECTSHKRGIQCNITPYITADFMSTMGNKTYTGNRNGTEIDVTRSEKERRMPHLVK